MALARRVASDEVTDGTRGEDVGAVVVERDESGLGRVVCTARDLRRGLSGENGDPLAHAVMRVIGLIARKRRMLAGGTETPGTVLLDVPRTQVEREVWDVPRTLKPEGYLCLGLEIYLTHEPCIMCAMALVHSRVSRVIFARRTRDSALRAHGSGYGLFWREELNWKFMCWQWIEAGDDGTTEDSFHA